MGPVSKRVIAHPLCFQPTSNLGKECQIKRTAAHIVLPRTLRLVVGIFR